MFLRLIKMIIAPLVFSTLVVGIAHMGDAASVGRIFVKAMGWFVIASLVSLTLGLILVNLLQPGDDRPAAADAGASANITTASSPSRNSSPTSCRSRSSRRWPTTRSCRSWCSRCSSASRWRRWARRRKTLIAAIDELAHVMLKVTGYVMKFAPFAVFAAMAATVATNGLGILLTLRHVHGRLLPRPDRALGAADLRRLRCSSARASSGCSSLIREPFLLAFSTASSEAAYPEDPGALERFGVKRKIASFVLPMGYSFNLDGSMMYCTFATLFIAQAYGIELSIGTQITMLLILMLTSKGMAGVPRASLVVIAATLNQFNIPEAGLLLILGVDHFLDMGRSATNVVGNSIATGGGREVGRRAAARGARPSERAALDTEPAPRGRRAR